MSAFSLPVVIQMLGNLGHFLDKAVEHVKARGLDETALLSSRLAPDMVPMSRQVTLACEGAIKGICRIAGRPLPALSKPQAISLQCLQSYVRDCIAFLETVPAASLEGTEDREVEWEVRDTLRHLPAEPYLKHWFLPNFMFHVTIAYGLLRQAGVDLGKFDYLLGARADSPDFLGTFDAIQQRVRS